MEKTKKIKLFIGLFYLVAVGLFLYFFFQNLVFKKLLAMNLLKIIEITFLNLGVLIYSY